MCLIAAALMTSLTGCAGEPATRPVVWAQAAGLIAARTQRLRAMAPVCPTPTDDGKARRIAGYLEAAPPAGGLDTLATEWERLDDGARICRTGKAR